MSEATPVSPVQDSTPVESSAPSQDTNKVDAQDSSQAEESQPNELERIKSSFEKRIARLTADRQTQVRLREEAEARAREFEASRQDAPKPPEEKDFANVEDYYKALGKFERDQEVRKEQAEAKRKHEAERIQAENAKTAKALEDKAAKYRAENPSYVQSEQVFQEYVSLANTQSPSFRAFADAIVSSDLTPELIDHLGQNPDVLETIFDKSPAQIYREISKIEQKLATSEPEPVKQVSAPPSPVVGKGKVVTRSLQNMDAKQLVAWSRK